MQSRRDDDNPDGAQARERRCSDLVFRPAPLRHSAAKLHDVVRPNWQRSPPLFLVGGSPDLDCLAGVWENAERRLPRVEEASMKTLNASLYEVSPDHNASLGKVPDLPQFVLANRFSGHGMQHTPVAGRAISEVIADRASTTLDISAFSVARFGEGPAVPEGA